MFNIVQYPWGKGNKSPAQVQTSSGSRCIWKSHFQTPCDHQDEAVRWEAKQTRMAAATQGCVRFRSLRSSSLEEFERPVNGCSMEPANRFVAQMHDTAFCSGYCCNMFKKNFKKNNNISQRRNLNGWQLQCCNGVGHMLPLRACRPCVCLSWQCSWFNVIRCLQCAIWIIIKRASTRVDAGIDGVNSELQHYICLHFITFL